ncbi:hypothetical protein PPACK8108_LOCUS4741 [Phakopsora pachyrhizi]|uniref:Uncharacterized protein n=1 Tax=Phakopsora pachyrhizi TaxID=170000 RepID=A0AAV0AQS3_PHAPC|nr:hypothetical protein PPACK8108_LOCUS4741 [Phakopsora pachyrhizi]
MTPLENNAQIFSPTFPFPTVSLLCPISSPSTFLNTNTGCITEHNEREQDDNSSDNSEDNKDENENEAEDNDANELVNPNLKNYQGTLTKSETNPIDINMKASSQDAIFDGEIEVITKKAFLKNIMMVNRHLCLVIDNPSLPSYIQEVISGSTLPLDSNIKIGNAALLHKRKRSKNKMKFEISESHTNPIHNPDNQPPQSFAKIQIPLQGETSNSLTCNNISHQPTNSNTPGDPINIPSNLKVGPPASNCTPLNTDNSSDLAINTAVTKSTNTRLQHSIPEVPLPVPVSCPSQFFLQHEDALSATLGNIYHLKTSSWNITLSSILALVKNRNSRIEGVDLPNYLPFGIEINSDYGTSISQWLKHLDNVG